MFSLRYRLAEKRSSMVPQEGGQAGTMDAPPACHSMPLHLHLSLALLT